MNFDELHDPDPPRPTSATLAAVAGRARTLRRRRTAMVTGGAIIAAAAVVVPTALVVTGQDDEGGRLVPASVPASDPSATTQPPETAPGTAPATTSTVPATETTSGAPTITFPPTTVAETTETVPETSPTTTAPETAFTSSAPPTTGPPDTVPSDTTAPPTTQPTLPNLDEPATVAILGNGDAVRVGPDGTQELLYDGADPSDPPAEGELTLVDSIAVMADGRVYVSTCCEPVPGAFFDVSADPSTARFGHGLAVSPDGTRLASVGYYELAVRDADGLPIASIANEAGAADPYDVMWVDADRLAVLWRPAGADETRLSVVTTDTLDTFDDAGVVVPFDGSSTEGVPQPPMSFAGMAASGAILVLDGDVADTLLAYDPDTLELRPAEAVVLPGQAISAWVDGDVLSWVATNDELTVVGDVIPGEYRWVRRFG